MPMREKGFAICVENRGAEDLEVRKVYRVLHDKDAAATGYVRVIDESGDDYLYPADYFVFVELPHKAKRAWTATRSTAKRRSSSNKPLQRTGARVARSGRGAPSLDGLRLTGGTERNGDRHHHLRTSRWRLSDGDTASPSRTA